MGALGDKLDPALVTPIVAYLAHESCEATGRVFSVRRWARRRGVHRRDRGLLQPRPHPRRRRHNWVTITDRDGYHVPTNLGEETAMFLPFLG